MVLSPYPNEPDISSFEKREHKDPGQMPAVRIPDSWHLKQSDQDLYVLFYMQPYRPSIVIKGIMLENDPHVLSRLIA